MSREYVDRIDVNGTIGYVKETITGEGAPTESTVGFVGQRYVDAADVKEYICAGISVTDGEKRYIWQAGGALTNVGDPPKILWLERGAPTLYTKGEYGMYAFDKHFGLLYAYSGNFPADDTDDGLHHLWALSPGYSNYNYPPTKNSYGEWGQLWADYSACELYMCVGRDIDPEDKKLIYLWEKVSGSLTEEDYAAIAQEAAKLVDVPAIDDTLKVDGAAADAAKVGEGLSQLSDAIADYGTLTLGIHTDGLMYIFKNGTPLGNGIELPEGGGLDGYVDSDKNIVLKGAYPEGTIVMLEMEDGTSLKIGEVVYVSDTLNNLADPTSADWLVDYRLSTTSGNTSANAGHITTNFIQAQKGDVLRVKGLDITAVVNTKNSVVHIYDANKTWKNLGITSVTSSQSGDGAKEQVSISGDVYTYTILMTGTENNRADANTTWVRMCGKLLDGYTSNDVVITINKAIE